MKTVLAFFYLLSFQFALAQPRYAVIIDELMADPSPTAGLPSYEWTELKNISGFPVNVQGWRVGDKDSRSGPFPVYTLQPDSFLIICGAAAFPLMSGYGNAVSVTGFPSLDNEGDVLILESADGRVIHAVDYQLSWYGNELKSQGGWSLEMVDPRHPCTGASNWLASNSAVGGTPGAINTVDGPGADINPPRLMKAYFRDSASIILEFDESLDSMGAGSPANYTIQTGTEILSVKLLPPIFKHVELLLSSSATAGKIYSITVREAQDCSANRLELALIKTGIPQEAEPGDWVINEILFNPRSSGYDYVEVYNAGNKILDIAGISIANRAATGNIANIRSITNQPAYVFPGEYRVLTEDAANLGLQYLVRYPENVLQTTSLPSYPDQEGTAVLLNGQGSILDEVHYTDGWHFPLIANPEGIALERIDPLAGSNIAANWASAASTAGYGTPGYQNSQYRQPASEKAGIQIHPAVFSPDNDGLDDVVAIHYQLANAGYTANLNIYSSAGILVRQLVRNGTLSTSGYWNWDGLDDRGQPLPIGHYIILTEIFNLEGKTRQFKNILVLARRLH